MCKKMSYLNNNSHNENQNSIYNNLYLTKKKLIKVSVDNTFELANDLDS